MIYKQKTLVHVAIIIPVEINSTYINFSWHLYKHAVIQYNIIGNLLQQSDAVIATNISEEKMGAKGKRHKRHIFKNASYHETWNIKDKIKAYELGSRIFQLVSIYVFISSHWNLCIYYECLIYNYNLLKSSYTEQSRSVINTI